MEYEEFDIFSSSLTDLQCLQREFSSLLSWSCNNNIRQLVSKIATKVHKEKNHELRRILLSEIAASKVIVNGLLTLCQDSSEATLLSNVIAILREGVAAKSTWRPQVLSTLYQSNATEVVTKMLIRMVKMNEKGKQKNGLSNHSIVCSFWILSALAAKDVNFSVKIRSCGCLKLLVAILKHLAVQPTQLYAVLQCMKALSRNSVTATLLGREGIMSVISEIISKLAESSFGPKLKVAAEVLSALTKSKPNQILFLKQKFIGELLDILCRNQSESEQGKVAAKIAGSILETFLHIVPSKVGFQQFIEFGGIGVLRNFCLKLESTEKNWDRLLCRACTVLSQCSVSKPLPLDQESGPLTFALPKECQNIIVDESPSDSTSRETTPESDDENEVDENDNDEENENEEENFPECSQDLDEENVSALDLQPVEQRTQQEIENSYKKVFAEFFTSNLSKSEDNENCNNKFCENGSYLDYASRVRGLAKFVKCAYPDMVGAGSPPKDTAEPLLEKNRRNYRAKLIQNMKTLLNERTDEEMTVVYDLDKLMMEEKLRTNVDNANCVYERLSNDDESQIFEMSKQENSSRSRTRAPLQFESRFESGNLRKAIRIRDREYNLILSPDVNSPQQHQWFYFQVSNMAGGVHSPYTFNIINYEKANSQFNFGMQPVMFSVKESLLGRPHWRRAGEDVCYFRNHFSKTSLNDSQNYMTVTFTVTFPHEADICYLAYHYPYTYSRMMRHLDILKEDSRCNERDSEDQIYFRVDKLTESLNGHPIPLVTITAPFERNSCTNNNQILPLLSERRIVVLSARVHPGETNASWIMEGLLDYLTSDTYEAKELRANYVFKIVPMLNNEGTINGSHRCGLTGEDLNRRWRDPHRFIHPEIFHTKGLLSFVKLVLDKDIFLFCDLHGHSRKKNVFLYGCSSDQSWWSQDRDFEDDPSTYSELADVFSSLEECVDKKSCRYAIERSRESTARVVVWREFEVSRSYTLEASFCGCNKGELTGRQMSTNMLSDVGKNFGRSLLYLDPNPSETSTYDEFQSQPFQCRASVEKDEALNITRLVISMPKA